MKYTEIDDLAPEELEHAHINAWEKGEEDKNNNHNGDTMEPKSKTSEEKEDRAYGNLWLSEEDPRAIPPPKLICPTHRIMCKKGICEDMTKLLRAEKRKELEAQWEAEGKNKKKGTFLFLYLFFAFFFFFSKLKPFLGKARKRKTPVLNLGAAIIKMMMLKAKQALQHPRLMETILLSLVLAVVLGNIKNRILDE